MEHRPRRIAPVIEVELAKNTCDHRALILAVVDDEVAREADGFAKAPEEARARSVDRPTPQLAGDLRAEQAFEPMLHLAGGLVREGDGRDAVWGDIFGRD